MKKHLTNLAMVATAVTTVAANFSVAEAAQAKQAKAHVKAMTTLTMYTSGDVNVQNLWENQLIPLYQKSHPNVKFNVVYSAHGANDDATKARIIAAEKAHKNSGYDIIDAGLVNDLAKTNLLQKLNTKEVPFLSHIDPSLLKQTSYEGMPYRASSVVLAYNSAAVDSPPKTLDDLIQWIQSNPGKFTYNSPNTGGSGDAFVTAVVNSKVPAADRPKMVTGSDKSLESDWKDGLDLLNSLNSSVYRKGFYPNGNTAVLNLLASNSIWVAPVWSDMALSALAQHQLPSSIKLIQLNPPFSGGPATLGVPANSPNKVAADAFLNWLLSPTAQTVIVNQMHGYPGVQWKYMPKSVQTKFADIAKSYASGWSSTYSSDLTQQWQDRVPQQQN